MNKLAAFAASALVFPLVACSVYSPPPAAPVSLAATNIYAVNVAGLSNGLDGQILTFPVSATGSATPSATFTDIANNSYGDLVVDSSGNLYTISGPDYGGTGTVSVNEFSHTTTGVLTQTRSFSSSAFNSFGRLAVDKTGNVYVGSGTKTLVFAPTATGVTTPTIILNGYSGVMATDASGNLYIQNGTGVAVFNSGFTSSSTPSRTITSGTPTIAAITGVAADPSGNTYVLANSSVGNPEILVFAPTASTSATPTRIITGSLTTMNQPGGIAVDGNGTIYIYDFTSAAPFQGVFLSFSSTANGNVAPSSKFSSAAATYSPGAIAVY